jgi:hypothetical protein
MIDEDTANHLSNLKKQSSIAAIIECTFGSLTQLILAFICVRIITKNIAPEMRPTTPESEQQIYLSQLLGNTDFDETLLIEEDPNREREGTYAEGFSFDQMGTIRGTEKRVSLESRRHSPDLRNRLSHNCSGRSIKIPVANSLGTDCNH